MSNRVLFVLALAALASTASAGFHQGHVQVGGQTNLSFADSPDDACLARIRHVVALASAASLPSGQKAELYGAFSSFSPADASGPDARCRAELVRQLSVLSVNASGSGQAARLGAFDPARAKGTVFMLDGGAGGPIRIQLVASAPDRIGFDAWQADEALCRWPDTECVLQDDASETPRFSATLASLFRNVRIRDGLAYFEIQPLPRKASASLCRVLSGTDVHAPIQVAFAPSRYANVSVFLEDLSRELDLLRVSMGPLYRKLAITFTKSNVACEPRTAPDAQGRAFYRCDTSSVQEACGTNSVVVLVAATRSLRGSASGTVASCSSESIGCVRHELSHVVLGLSDRYCCDGGYHPPDVYPDEAACMQNREALAGVLNTTYRDYLIQVLADALDLQTAENPDALASQMNRVLSTPLACVGLSQANGSASRLLNQKSLMYSLRVPQFTVDELEHVRRLFNATAPASSSAVPHALLQLEFNDRNLTLNDFRIVRFPARTAPPVFGNAINYTYYDSDGRRLESYALADPRYGLDEEDANGTLSGHGRYDPHAAYALLLPYRPDAQRLDARDAQGLLGSIVLNESLSPYCRALSYISDGYCEPLCATDADCRQTGYDYHEPNATPVPNVLQTPPQGTPSGQNQDAQKTGDLDAWILVLLFAFFGFGYLAYKNGWLETDAYAPPEDDSNDEDTP